MISQFLAAAAAVGLMGAGLASASQTRSFEAMTGQIAMYGAGETAGVAGGMCRVDVVRSGSAGTADITRQTFSDGSCVCTVTTGPAASNGSAETVVSDLLNTRECTGAPVAGNTASQAAVGGGGGMGGGAVISVLFGVAALGVGVGAGGGKKDSAG